MNHIYSIQNDITTSKIIFFFLSFFVFVLKPLSERKDKNISLHKNLSHSWVIYFWIPLNASDFEVFSALQKSRKHVCVVIWSSMIIFVPLHCSDFKSPTNITIACYPQNGYISICGAWLATRGHNNRNNLIYSPGSISDFNRD